MNTGPLATYQLSTLLRRAYDGACGANAKVAAHAMVAIGLDLEDEGRHLTSTWATDTYLALLNVTETRKRVGQCLKPARRRTATVKGRERCELDSA